MGVSMGSVLTQPNTTIRVTFFDDVPERREDLGYVRHQLDTLAYARAVCGLRPKEEIEYRRLCEREQAMLEVAHRRAG
jgi:hypothetical protein